MIRRSNVCWFSFKILRIGCHKIKSICDVLDMNPRNILASIIKFFSSELWRHFNKWKDAIWVTEYMPNSRNHSISLMLLSKSLKWNASINPKSIGWSLFSIIIQYLVSSMAIIASSWGLNKFYLIIIRFFQCFCNKFDTVQSTI